MKTGPNIAKCLDRMFAYRMSMMLATDPGQFKLMDRRATFEQKKLGRLLEKALTQPEPK